ncbi:hypothetical protein [Paracoccus jeotgali]|uniref:Dynamin n=1 Tax=Paracoccus jeotgali TaxID=2065379 RepID=A0A2K9MFW5_9RHOB|nr:hypothetical protein [Paracoccus jeotgali]AUM74537.1 hypothetical protein CYR75_09820 [Paracoccus jeotgali]
MANPNESSNNNLYFIVGALVVAVALVFWLMSGSNTATTADAPATTVTVEDNSVTPAAPVVEAPAADAPVADVTPDATTAPTTEEPVGN